MKLLEAIADKLFPANFTCDICGRETFDDTNLCPACRATVTYNDGLSCPVCGRKTTTEGACLECKKYSPSYDRAVSALVYADGGAALITKFKRGGAYLKDALAELMIVKCVQLDADCVTYIPMTARAERARGYNQAKLLAKEIAAMLGLPLLPLLKKIKDTPEQKQLTRRQRAENLKGCFSAKKAEVAGRSILVVDDVMTTGSTLLSCAGEILRAVPDCRISVAALAVSQRELGVQA